MRKLTTLFIALLLLSEFTHAQEVLTLEKCMEIALDNNLQIKTAENNVLIAKSNRVQAIMQFLPDLNAGIDYSLRYGLGFDTSSGQLIDRITRTSSPFLSSGWTVFGGFQNTYGLKGATFAQSSAEQNLENTKLTTKNNVLTAYLNVILDKERIRISEERIELLSGQLEREKQRESVGVGDMEQVFNFQSQLATEKLNLVTLNNALRSDKLQLLQIMTLAKVIDYKIEPEDISDADLLKPIQPYDQVLSNTISYNPGLKSATADYESARFGYKQSIAAMSPTVSIRAVWGTNYSNNFLDENDMEVDWATQRIDNAYRRVSFSLNIPIFNQFRARNSMQVSRLNMRNAEISIEQAEQTILNTTQQVYLDLVTAQETYKAALENLRALDQSFQFVKTRYEAGRTDFYTYLESLNNKNRAEIELVNAKYSIVFRQKIMNLLQGIK